jgi:hypothetical protein
MERGSWRDPQIARDVTVTVAVCMLVVLVAAMPTNIRWLMVLGPGGCGVLVAVLLVFRNARTHATDDATPLPHRGPNVSRIPVAGVPGFLLAAGFVWMFWFGLPGMRPLVLGVVAAGALLGAALILLERRHRVGTSTPLGLSSPGAPEIPTSRR